MIDRKTGKILWQQEWEGAMSVPFFAASNGSWIRATPAYDDGRLYVAGMRDVLVCLNAKNGDVIWKIDFPKETGSTVPTFGFVCSPLIDGNNLYVQAGGALCKIDKKTGKLIWRSIICHESSQRLFEMGCRCANRRLPGPTQRRLFGRLRWLQSLAAVRQ